MRIPFGERSSKTLPARSESLAAKTVSIQPLGGRGFGVEDKDGAESSKPKSLHIRVGKVREKNQRDWSGKRWCKKDEMEVHAEEICDGDEAAMMMEARSWDLDWESVVYE